MSCDCETAPIVGLYYPVAALCSPFPYNDTYTHSDRCTVFLESRCNELKLNFDVLTRRPAVAPVLPASPTSLAPFTPSTPYVSGPGPDLFWIPIFTRCHQALSSPSRPSPAP